MQLIHRLVMCLLIVNLGFSQDLPNHLEPIRPPAWSQGLEQAVDALVPSGHRAVWMVAAPSFETGWAVSIIKENMYGQDSSYSVWFIKSRDPLMLPPPPPPFGNNKAHRRSSNPNPRPLHKYSAALDSKTADRVISVWRDCIKGTRYFGNHSSNGGLDGISYFFYADRQYYGQTWGPLTKTPTALVSLAQSLSEFAKANPSNRQLAHERINFDCANLEKCLRTN